ncbi:hypothetical protein Q669_29455 [Labrenzia sp. C1B10]|uniref:phage BR0599 family protein n=1 Tax=unclassified Labrenzia TaxID=2648686 RepID=UPI0003B91A32|nr:MULTISPECIES: phage BR0599 family protein [unclassified Labrenzia]ERP95698.1 hypothetical protein Q669_29455 [Labrenzia sp. C1B10]ERS05764.1 hypothetical protein Q675_29020 [Labrenzia sp. C1B70]
MPFQQIEESRFQGVPVELYEFRYGTGETAVLRYTNADEDISFEGVEWKAIPINRQAYKSSGKVEKSSVTITVPVDEDLSLLFTDFPPTQEVSVIIRSGHFPVGPDNVVAVWSGRVLSTAKKDRTTELSCDSTPIRLNRPGLRRNFQFGCPFVLYGHKCLASKANASVTSSVVSIDDGKLSLQANWWGAMPVEKFVNGVLSWDSDKGREHRTIRAVDAGGAITFIGPLRDIDVGTAVSIALGCNHQMSDCENLHNNIQNFGGQPWIPTKNPFKYHPFW